jgi:N-methylhydantoinase B/oxoprolinase/acetone carboxylase alpha subunit
MVGCCSAPVNVGERIFIETPGGGGYVPYAEGVVETK